MPQFYFDTKNEEQLSEDDCFEFASTDEATRHAIRYLAEAAADNVTHLTPTIICTVRDEQKRPLVRLRLSLEVEKEKERAAARAVAPTRSQVTEIYGANAANRPPAADPLSPRKPSIDQ